MIFNLRSAFCGYQEQHQAVFSNAIDFLQNPYSGAFVVGGSNLTGKSTLLRQILNNSGLESFGLPEDLQGDPRGFYLELHTTFADMYTNRLRDVQVEDFYRHMGTFDTTNEALNHGVRTIVFQEIWAGHLQPMQLIADEFMRKYGCKVVFDVVSSEEGRGFFDGQANNAFIAANLGSIFREEELHLSLLDFNRDALVEAVRELALKYRNPREFDIAITQFSAVQRKTIIEGAQRGNLDAVLHEMLDLGMHRGIETW